MMKKRLIAVLLSVGMVAALTGGCGSSTDNTTDGGDSADAAEEESEEAEEEEAQPAVQSGTVTFDIDMSQYEAGKTVRVWVPVAQTNDYQTIEDVTYEAEGTEAVINEDALGNQMMYVEWGEDADPASRTASVSFHVTRPEILRPELVEEGEPGEELDEYLEASSSVPTDGEVLELAEDITKDETTYLGKARAIYDWIIENMNRNNDITGCGKGDVCASLDTLEGKCTDINSVFVGLCRSIGIPAREMFGVRINDTDITGNQHCWAEFYLPGTGWVAADPADVLKAVLTNEWDKDSDETKEIQEYYWGNCDEKRVELSSGRDITLSPAQDGETLNNFGYPYAEVDGEAVDYYTPDAFVYTISFAEDE